MFLGELLHLELAVLRRADAVDLEVLHRAFGARVERHRRHARKCRVVADAGGAEELRQKLLFDRCRTTREDDEKDTAKEHATRHRTSSSPAPAKPGRRRRAYSSSSFSASRAIETARSSPSMSISFTPCVARPMVRMSFAAIRRILPCCVMSINSASSDTCAIPMTLPLRSDVWMLMMPMPPRD